MMPKKHDSVVIIPVLNEEDAILQCLHRWTEFGWDIHFVDGMSRDRTVEIIERFVAEKKLSDVVDVRRTYEKQGLAFNSCLGLRDAISRGYEYVIVADAGTQDPADAWRMLEVLRSRPNDALIARGSYFKRGSSVHNFPIYRRFVTFGATVVARLVFGPGTGTYPTHAFKVWPRKALAEIPFEDLVNGRVAHCVNGPEFQVAMTWLALRHGWTIVEFPMTFFGSKSTFRWQWIPRFFKEVFRIRGYSPERRDLQVRI